IVQEILVNEADTVEKGDVLLRLNGVEASSILHVVNTRLDVARIAEARLLAERQLAETIELPDLDVGASSDIVESAIADQKDLFQNRWSIQKSRTDILASRIGQVGEQIEGLELQKSALERRVANYMAMIERMRSGEERGLIQKNTLSQQEDEMIQIEASLGQV